MPASDVGSAKDKIDRLKRRKSQIGERIGAAKRDRDEMFRLRDEGLDRKAATAHVATAQQSVSERCSTRRKIESSREEFRNACRRDRQLPRLLDDLERMRASRKDFEASFSRLEERAKRRSHFEEEFHARMRSQSS